MTKLNELYELIDTKDTIIAITGDHGESIYDGTLRNFLVKNLLEYFQIPIINKTTGDLLSRSKFIKPGEILS
jgi:predicted AlkP superfamily pyrophosphatase or phosphodiesterase